MISVIIPVYKNKDLFLKNFQNNLKFLKNEQIIVVNDDPDENLTAEIQNIHKSTTVINNSYNYGFGKSVNLGVSIAKTDFLFFLNSDVLLLDDSYKQALTMFKDQKLFALSFAQIEKDGHITGANGGHFYKGLFHHFEKTCQSVCSNLWPEGGSSIVSKKMFLELQGFDEIYSPFYWEDVDLGYRAMKKGYRTLFYPQVTVKHHHQSTINKYYSKNQVKTISHRNQFIFVWKNIKGWQFLNHLLWLPILFLQNRHNKEFRQGFLEALKQFRLQSPKVDQTRKQSLRAPQ